MSEIKDPVNLRTFYVCNGEPDKITGPYPRGMLKKWVRRATEENSESILAWEIIEIEEKI